jgi:hypothetical protein
VGFTPGPVLFRRSTIDGSSCWLGGLFLLMSVKLNRGVEPCGWAKRAEGGARQTRAALKVSLWDEKPPLEGG